MSEPRRKQKQSEPGVWPAGETREGLQRSLVFYSPNRLSTHHHLNRFFDYLEYAELSRALAVLTKLYFRYRTIPDVAEIFNFDEMDEFALIIDLFVDIASKEGAYIAEDREQILAELYQKGYYQKSERGSNGK